MYVVSLKKIKDYKTLYENHLEELSLHVLL